MRKDLRVALILVFFIGLFLGLIIQNAFNILYAKELKNSLDINLKISQGKTIINNDNESQIPENAIIDYNGELNKKFNITQNATD